MWRDEFGWQPNETNPLILPFEGEQVTRYEQLYGVPSESPRGPSYRRRLIDSSIISDGAFAAVESSVGALRARHTVDVALFCPD